MGEQLTIKACRVNKGMTQKEMAEKMGVSVNTIVNWESYEHSMSAPQLMQFSEIVGRYPSEIKLKN